MDTDADLERAIAMSLAMASSDAHDSAVAAAPAAAAAAAEGADTSRDAEIAAGAGEGGKGLEQAALITAQREAIEAEIVATQPLVGKREAPAALEEEYRDNPLFFAAGIADLGQRYSGLRRVRGDENCFCACCSVVPPLMEYYQARVLLLGLLRHALTAPTTYHFTSPPQTGASSSGTSRCW